MQKIPDWDWSCGDAALCPMELKLGFMAKSCLVPGLSTLLANLFTMQGEVEVRSQHGYTHAHARAHTHTGQRLDGR